MTHVRRWLIALGVAIVAGGLMSDVASASTVRTVGIGQNVTIAYKATGHGRPLVMIPGSGMAMDLWDPLFIGRLAKHHRVIVFDPRGVGLSTGSVASLTVTQMADDTARLIRALHLDHPDVLGWSMGGFIAEKLVLRHPDSLRRLVLASSDAGGTQAIRASPDILAIDELVTLGQASLEQILGLLFPPEGIEAGGAWLTRYLSQPGCCEVIAPETAQAQVDAINLWYEPGNGVYGRLPSVGARTLVTDGREDIDVPIANASMLAARIPHSRLAVFAHSGHAFLFQFPLRVVDRIDLFLRAG